MSADGGRHAPQPPLLEMRGIEKRFGDLRANRAVDLVLGRGEILGLLGENGAGKTTLMNVLFGLYGADAGEILIDGAPAQIEGPADALSAGIGMVHQHFHLVPRHTVLENLMVGAPGRGVRLDTARARPRLAELGRQYHLELDPDQEVGALSVGEQQRLEIAKALFRGARILILDEPTSVLTPQQAEGLFDAVRALAADGVGVIFISHKLGEVLGVTHRLAIMRRGEVVASAENDGTLTRRGLAELMCGHDIAPPSKTDREPGRVLLELGEVELDGDRGRPARLAGVTLALRAGEILGVAGVSGNGQRELAEVVAGVTPPSRGTIAVDGREVPRPTPRRMQRLGVAHVPEDRMGAGLLTTLPLRDSVVLSRFTEAPFSRFGLLSMGAIRRFVNEQMERFDIRAASPEVRAGTLSGGNLQKALLARELAFGPKVLVAAQPTRGLDVSAVEFVHRQFLRVRDEGRAVLLISEDLEELFALSDRLAVMYEGRIAGELRTAETSPAEVGLLMAGGGA